MEQKKQNENQEKKQVMILAVLPGDDCDDTIRDLNEEGFFVTLLSSSGGFLKKKSTTVMIGAREEELDEILGLSDRIDTIYDGRIVGSMMGKDADENTLGLMMAGGKKA